MAEAVRQAIMLGYRHIDCAAVYGNEREIGVVLRELYAAGVVQREELWLTSKVWNDHHGDGDVLLSCAKSLKDLGTDYLDLMLIHWPFPNFHPPRCTVASRSPDAKPYIHDDFMRVYRQLERLADMGLTRHIGISNVTIPKLKLIIRDCRIKPAVNEMELHPHLQQPELFEFSQQLGILNIGYCPLGSPNRPERDKTPNDTVDMDDQVIVKIAQDHKVHPAAICLKWAVQRGNAAIPMSANPKNIRANLAAVCSDPLTAAEMSAINQIDRQCRLVKGHVFLWNSAKDWNDLWDIDGFITQ
jgi:diketogulonate reductase-like aldo/keto reductase